MKILLVDDEADVQLLLEQRFFRKEIRRGDIDFISALSGPDLDIILSDIDMPVMDAESFSCNKLGEVNLKNKHAPVVTYEVLA
jgi:response regulator RpfG family c-di-GMP phosphodiesterase